MQRLRCSTCVERIYILRVRVYMQLEYLGYQRSSRRASVACEIREKCPAEAGIDVRSAVLTRLAFQHGVQHQLYGTLLRIEGFWRKKLHQVPPKLPSRKRCMGDPDEGPSDEEDGGDSRKGKGKEKEKGPQAKRSKKPMA